MLEESIYFKNSSRTFVYFVNSFLFTSYFPRFGFNFPERIFKAVDFPIPFVPTIPRTFPCCGTGNLK